MHADFVRTARGKGMPDRLVVWRLALRNALTPLIIIVGLNLPTLVGGAVAIEVVFWMFWSPDGVDATRTCASRSGLRGLDCRIEKLFESSFSCWFRNDRQHVACLEATVRIRKKSFRLRGEVAHLEANLAAAAIHLTDTQFELITSGL